MEEKAIVPYRNEMETLNSRYLDALNRRKAATAKTGNLDKVMEWQAEIDRLKSGQELPQKDPPEISPAVAKLRNVWRVSNENFTKMREEKSIPLYQAWDAALDAMQKDLTKELDLKAAKLVMEKRQEIRAGAPANISAALTPSISKRSPERDHSNPFEQGETGRLVFEGLFAGKPISIPENMKTLEFDWVIENGHGPLVHSPKKGVFQFGKDGWKSLDFKNVKMLSYPIFVWKDTALTASNELRWQHRNGKSGKIRNVANTELGGGTFRGGNVDEGSLVALTADGRLELILFGAKMEWEFAEWAEKRRFRDMALSPHLGIEAAVLTVTSAGTLEGFNHHGPLDLPKEITSNVASVHSGTDGVFFTVLKENGDMFWYFSHYTAFKPGDKLEPWSQVAEKSFGNKKPTNIEINGSGQVVQFEDGTWLVFGDRRTFDNIVFPEVTSQGPLKTLKYLDIPQKGHQYVIGIR